MKALEYDRCFCYSKRIISKIAQKTLKKKNNQQKTSLLWQDPAEKRDYELIETIITFQNSSYIKEVISSDVIKGAIIPENIMTFYYIMPDATVKKLHELLSD